MWRCKKRVVRGNKGECSVGGITASGERGSRFRFGGAPGWVEKKGGGVSLLVLLG